MTNRDLAEKIYEDLNKRGADLGNASIGIIHKTLDDNGVKNCSISRVVRQSEQLICPSCSSQVIVSDERHNIKMCGVCKEQWAN